MHGAKTWLVLGGVALAGIALGVLLVGLAPLLLPSGPAAGPLLEPQSSIGGTRSRDVPPLDGRATTMIEDFELRDLQDVTVVKVAQLSAVLDLEGLNDRIIRMPRGKVSNVDLLLRRGKSGRVSVAEAFGGKPPSKAPPKLDVNRLQIGPLSVRNARVNVALIDRPVVFQVDRAIVRVQRTGSDRAPRIFLSDIHGYMVEPDPLSQPVRIHAGEGVVDLAADPLVDIRTTVCVGGSAMRVRVELPDRREPLRMQMDAEGLLARAVLVALNVVSKVKSEKLKMSATPVVVEKYDCTREEGREKREEIDEKE